MRNSVAVVTAEAVSCSIEQKGWVCAFALSNPFKFFPILASLERISKKFNIFLKRVKEIGKN